MSAPPPRWRIEKRSYLLFFLLAVLLAGRHQALSAARLDDELLAPQLALTRYTAEVRRPGSEERKRPDLTLGALARVKVVLNEGDLKSLAFNRDDLAWLDDNNSVATRPAAKANLPVGGIKVNLARGESPWELARRHNIRLSDLLAANNIVDAENLRPGMTLILPGARRYIARPTMNRRFQLPVNGKITSGFGLRIHPISGMLRLHRGVDIAAAPGTAIIAVQSGVVTYSGPRGGYGNMVEIRHADGTSARYAHNLANKVKIGTRVKAGQAIGRVGATGVATGPHVHFEILRNGHQIAPLGKKKLAAAAPAKRRTTRRVRS